MYRILLIGLLLGLLMACSGPEKAFEKAIPKATDRDQILLDIITYVYKKPPGATNQNRFEERFREQYLRVKDKFTMLNYSISAEGTHYFLILRPAVDVNKRVRYVAGSYNLSDNTTITDFQEIVVSPLLEKEQAIKNGQFMFQKLVEGALEEYINMPHYVEFPNANWQYDKKEYEWIYKGDQ